MQAKLAGCFARARTRALRPLLLAAMFAGGLVGCEEEIIPASQAAPAGPGAGGAAAAAKPATADAANLAVVNYRDTDFVESERNRDPFRSFASELKSKVPMVAQRAVIMPNTPIDAMRLIAIISGINQPRAMLVDERGVGYVTARGDFVGRADVVQGGGTENLPIALNWRVDRIRENEIVLAREDPSAPNRPPLTKVIPLHDEKDTPPDDQG
jgi:type IV pilus assembly protein PilP